MPVEKRKDVRYKEMGHVEAPLICALSGVLEDVSLSGVKVHFPCPVILDDSKEYELKLKMSQKPKMPAITIFCKMEWSKVTDVQTVFGFRIVKCDDKKLLEEYIDFLKESSQDDENIEDMIPIKGPVFVK